MNYKVFMPSKVLQDIIKHYVVLESLENIDSLLFLPNGGNFIILNRGMKAYTKSFCNSKVYNIPQIIP